MARHTSTRSASACDSVSRSWTAAFNIIRVGDGRYCGAVRSLRGITPDGFVSSCVEATKGTGATDSPFIVGRVDAHARTLEVWEDKVATLRSRTGESLPHCRTCYMVDTCAGGCMSRALAQTGTIHARDEENCVVTRRINPELAADLAEGRLVPDAGWLPFSSSLTEGRDWTARDGGEGSLHSCRRSHAARLVGEPGSTPLRADAAWRAGPGSSSRSRRLGRRASGAIASRRPPARRASSACA